MLQPISLILTRRTLSTLSTCILDNNEEKIMGSVSYYPEINNVNEMENVSAQESELP